MVSTRPSAPMTTPEPARLAPSVAIERASSTRADLDADRRGAGARQRRLALLEPGQDGIGRAGDVGHGLGPGQASPPRQAASESVKASAG